MFCFLVEVERARVKHNSVTLSFIELRVLFCYRKLGIELRVSAVVFINNSVEFCIELPPITHLCSSFEG